MDQRNSSPRTTGLVRPLAIALMLLGAAGFLAATLLYRDQVLYQLGSTLVVFLGLGLVLAARRRQTTASQPADQPDDGPYAEDAYAHSAGMHPANQPGGLVGDVLAVYERKQAGARVAISRPGRSVVQVSMLEGWRATVLVMDGPDEIDLPEVRALNALVVDHRSARGYLVARGGYTERAREWAEDRGLKLLDASELWMLAIG